MRIMNDEKAYLCTFDNIWDPYKTWGDKCLLLEEDCSEY